MASVRLFQWMWFEIGRDGHFFCEIKNMIFFFFFFCVMAQFSPSLILCTKTGIIRVSLGHKAHSDKFPDVSIFSFDKFCTKCEKFILEFLDSIIFLLNRRQIGSRVWLSLLVLRDNVFAWASLRYKVVYREDVTTAEMCLNHVCFCDVVAGEHPAAMQHGEHGSVSCIGSGPWWLTLLVATATAAFSSTYCTIRQNGLLLAVSRWWVRGQLWINRGSNVEHIAAKCLLQQSRCGHL